MGIVKLYIMYWGVFTVIIIAWVVPKVLPNITKNGTIFCAKLTKQLISHSDSDTVSASYRSFF